MLTKKVPLYFLIITFIITVVVSILGFCIVNTNKNILESDVTIPTNIESGSMCKLTIKRLNGFQFIHPLLFAEPQTESAQLNGCKNTINNIINKHKGIGDISSASVYIREFKQANWISINGNELYSPGSLLKVPELIAFYKMNEKQPGFLDKQIEYNNKVSTDNRVISFESNHIQVGKKYTIKELLNYMIVYSDNEATMLLNSLVDRAVFSSVFTDIGLKQPDFNSPDYKITASDYSLFLKELYNGSYLDFANSEACLSLLSKSVFRNGLSKELPIDCKVAHKFGEGGQSTSPNFSEAAIVYAGDNPYIITIMIKGYDMKVLPAVTAEISKNVYDFMLNKHF